VQNLTLLCLMLMVLGATALRPSERRLRALLDMEQYDAQGPPDVANPNRVEVNMYVRDICKVDTKHRSMKIQLTFRMEWNDARLVYTKPDNTTRWLQTNDPNANIWRPDIFFPNEIEAKRHDVPQPNVMFRIFPDGHVLMSQRLSLTVTCSGDEPEKQDQVICSVKVASYGHPKEVLELTWKSVDPIQMAKKLRLRDMGLLEFHTNTNTSTTITGEYAKLCVKFVFGRKTAEVTTKA